MRLCVRMSMSTSIYLSIYVYSSIYYLSRVNPSRGGRWYSIHSYIVLLYVNS